MQQQCQNLIKYIIWTGSDYSWRASKALAHSQYVGTSKVKSEQRFFSALRRIYKHVVVKKN
jgi:hypothetical protein